MYIKFLLKGSIFLYLKRNKQKYLWEILPGGNTDAKN